MGRGRRNLGPRTSGPRFATPDPGLDDAGYDALPPGFELTTRSAFALVRCTECGWEGPARRSHRIAVSDAAGHLGEGPAASPGA